jgi:sugar phosphate isomerase/epimerase
MSKSTPFSRRDFVKSAAGAGAAFGLVDAAQAAATGMYISLNSTLTGGKVGWPEFTRLAAKTGYGGVDVSLQAAMKEGVEATRTLLSGLRLRASYCSLPVTATRDEDAFRKSMEGLDEAAKFAAAIGCHRMTFIMPAGSETPKDELWKTLKARFTAVGAVLARHSVRLGFEFRASLQLRSASPYEFIWRMNEMLQFASECGPNMGLLLDSWHWYHSGASVDDILKAGKSRIVTVHVSDSAKMAPQDVRDNQRLLPGEGVIDLVAFLKALKEIGYEDGVSPEPFGRIPQQMSPEEGARLGIESTLAVMRKAGLVGG